MSEKTLDSSIGTTIRVEPPYNLQPAETITRELRYQLGRWHGKRALIEAQLELNRLFKEWLDDIQTPLKAQRTVGQVPPFRPISLFGWVP